VPAPRFYIIEDELVRCTLCPHRCRLVPGARGRCGVRRAAQGAAKPGGLVLETPYSGYISAIALDPIEKKPLYHWRPGSFIASVGFAGCNLHCPFCQNWQISQIEEAPAARLRLNPRELIAAVKAAYSENSSTATEDPQIAYTYSEPLVHAEYVIDCMEEARKENIANVLVTNGCVNSKKMSPEISLKQAGPAEAILSLCDAANIDLKCFSEKTYSAVLGGNLAAVLDFIRLAVEMKVHTELTTLVVPGLNDSEAELAKCAEFIASLDSNIAWHLSAYHPDWKWNAPPTDPAKISAAAKQARRVLPHVYAGNIAGEHNDTACVHCGNVLVQRRGYKVTLKGLSPKGCCANCGKPVHGLHGLTRINTD